MNTDFDDSLCKGGEAWPKKEFVRLRWRSGFYLGSRIIFLSILYY